MYIESDSYNVRLCIYEIDQIEHENTHDATLSYKQVPRPQAIDHGGYC